MLSKSNGGHKKSRQTINLSASSKSSYIKSDSKKSKVVPLKDEVKTLLVKLKNQQKVINLFKSNGPTY